MPKRSSVAVAFGVALRRWRQREGLSQTKVAALAGCTSVHISNLERGTSVPSLETLLALERAFGMTHGFLTAATARVLGSRLRT